MLRVGVVGVNNIGRIHAATYRDDSLSDLVARCNIGEMKTAAPADTTLYAEGGPTRRTGRA